MSQILDVDVADPKLKFNVAVSDDSVPTSMYMCWPVFWPQIVGIAWPVFV